MRIEIVLAIAATIVWISMGSYELLRRKSFQRRVHTIANAESMVELIELKIAILTVVWIMVVLGLFNKM